MTPEAIKRLCKGLAVVTVGVGGGGSMLVLPYACSWNFTWIAVAGVYLVAGAVLISGGLLSYAVLIRDEK